MEKKSGEVKQSLVPCKQSNSSAKNFVSLCHRIQSPELKYVKVSKVFLFLSLEYGKVIKLTLLPLGLTYG